MKSLLLRIFFLFFCLSTLPIFSQSLGNNTCATAVTVPTTGVCVTGNNTTATATGDGTASCFTVENGIWFKFVAPASGVANITTDDPATNFNSQLTLYSGTCGALTEMACDDNGGTGNTALIQATCLTPGQTYYVMMDGYAGDIGNFCIKITTVSNPLNDFCSCATILPLNGSCLNNQTTIGATDGWTGIVGCQSGNNPEVWYTFVADSSSATITVTSGSMGGNVEMILGRAPNCTSTFTTHSTYCAPSVASNTFLNLTIGATYYLTISSSGAAGTFTICGLSSTPIPIPGQDCPTAANLCSNAPFGQASSTAGFGVQEVNQDNSCWGAGGERQSRWYKFTVGTTGTLAFEINPNVNTDDYDWAIWDITTAGCPTTLTPTQDAIACNWWGTTTSLVDIEGSTGLSIYTTAATICSSQPGAVDNDAGTAGCQPYSFANFTNSTYGPLSVQAGRTYAILIDNFSTSNNGFSFIFGGTAHIGPVADFLTLKSCTSATLISSASASNTAYSWNYGDGATAATSYSTTHTYTAAGTYSTSLQVTNALGCVANYNSTIDIGNPSLVISPTETICAGSTTTLIATAVANNPQVVFTNTTVVAIPDNNSIGVNSTIAVSGISPTTVSTNDIVRVCINLTHPYDEDMDLVLTCPSGNTVILTSDNGVLGDNYTNTCFTGLISNDITVGIAPAVAPFTGYFNPETSFSNLNSCNINGNWVLNVKDDAAGGSGTLNSWSITFNSTSNTINYAWTPGATLSATNIANPVASPTTTTIYTVVATDAQGCSVTGTTQVVVSPVPTPTITSTNTLCLGSSLTFTGSGASTYTWSAVAAGGLVGSTGSTISATPTTTGNITYSLVVTGANSCTNTATKTITVSPVPTANAGTTRTLTCLITNTTLTGSGGGSYAWSGPGITGGGSTATPTINLPGTYSLVVTTLGCSSSVATVAVSQNTTAPTVSVSPNQTITCVAPTVTITGSATPSTSTPVWTGGVSSGATSYTATASSANVYTLTVTNPANDCTAFNTVTVSPSAGLPSISPAVISNSITCSLATAQVTLASTPAGNTYTWSGPGIVSGATTSVVTVSVGGTYSAVVTNTASLCSSSVTVIVPTNTTAPTPTATASGTLTCAASAQTVGLTASPSSGMTYTWTGTGITSGANSSSAVVNLPGTFSLAITNTVNGCTGTTTVAVIQNTTVPTVAAAASGSLNCTTTTVTANATTTTTPVTYNWSGPGITSGSGTGTVTVNLGGTYNYTVTNTNNSCSTTGTIGVTQNTISPNVTPTATNSLNCTVTTVTASASTTVTPVSYNWTGAGIIAGSGTGTITVNQGGTFNYTVTNTGNNCFTTGSLSITQNTASPLVVSSTTGSLNCTTNTVNVSASTGASPVSYTWAGTGITAGATTSVITVNQGGNFTYTVTNTSNNCTTTATEVVDQNTVTPSVTASNTGSLNCTTTTVNISATTSVTPVSYNWSGPGITAGSGTGTITVNLGGTYNYTVTNTANTCTTTGSQAITQNTTIPSVIAANTGSLNCTTTSVNVSATTTATPVSYNWSGPGITAGSGTGTITVNLGGTYNYTVTNTANTCSTTGSQAITQSTTAPSVAGANTGSLNCTVLTVNASATTSTTPVSYNWSGPGITAGSGTGTITVNQGGTYNYTVTNTANTCSTTGSQAITQSTTVPSVAGANTGSLNCTVLTVNASATTSTTPVSYNWSGPGITAGSGTGTITVNQGGTYNYTVTNTANTCSTTGSQSITQSTTAPSVAGANTGSLNCITTTVTVSATTSTTPVSYNWSGPGITAGAGTGTITVNQGGTYNYTVTNTANTCSTTGSQAITQNTAAPSVASANTGSLNCTVLTVNASATTSTTPVSYNWSGPGITAGSGTGTITVNLGGTYNYTVTNTANTCSTTGSQAITQSTTVPSVAGANTGSLNCTVLNVNASATTSTTPVSYNWSGPGITAGSGTGTITVNQGGTYDYTVTNTANTCSTTGSQAITQNTTAPTTTASTTGSITCVTNTISLNSTLAGMNYTWTAPAGSTVISGSSLQNAVGDGLGTYTLTVLNTINSCTFQTSVAAIQNITAPSTVTAGPDKALICNTPTVSLEGSASPGATANWLGGVATPNTFTTNTGAAGVYTLQAIEPTTGCYITSTVAVTQSTDNPVVNANPVTNSITCVNSVVNVGVTVTSTASVNYAWPTGTGISGPTNGATTTATLSGVYQVTITNVGNGCISINPISVPQNTTPVIVGTTPASSITCLNPTETLNITPAGANYTYTWTGSGIISGGSTTNPVVNTGGDYSVTVTNTVNGCTGTGAINVPMDISTPTVTISAPSVTTTCANPTITIVASSTPSAGVTYSWAAPGSGSLNTYTVSNPVASGSGIFTVVVTTTVNGCSSSLSQNTVEVIADAAIPSTTLTGNTETITCTNPTPTVNIAVSTNSVSYSWTPTSGIVAGTETTATPSFSAIGSYSVVVTNTVSGCATSINGNVVTVTENTVVPTMTLSSTVNNDTLTCATTSINVTPAITGSDLTYTWSPSAGISTPVNQANATFTASGIYTLAITNTITGCTSLIDATSTFTVYENIIVPTFTLNGAPSVTMTCSTPNATLSGTSSADPNSIYTWTTPIPSTVVGNPIIVSTAGIYSVTVTNTVNGCSTSSVSQATVEVIADSGIPTVTLSSTTETITCANPTPTGSIAASTNSVSYSWTPTSGIVAGTETTATPSFSAIGSYSVVVTNTVSGCATSINGNVVTVTENTVVPTMTLSSTVNNDTLTCSTTSINVTPAITGSDLTYTWSPSAGISTPVNQANATFTASGIYTLAITNTVTGCVSVIDATSTFTVYENIVVPTFTLNGAPSVTMTCSAPNATLSGTSSADPNSIYTWTTPIPSTVIGNPIVVSTAGIYSVTVTNTVNGCSTSSVSQATVEVIADSGIPTVTLSSTTETITCSNPTPTVNIAVSTNSVSYNWTPTSGIVAGTENTATPSFTAIGSYSVIVTNTVSGCATSSVSNVVTITQNTIAPTMTLTTAAANEGTLTCLTTSIVVTPTVLPSSSTYTWTSSTGTFTNTLDATFTSPDVYTLTVMDAVSGCTTSTTNPANIFTVYQYTVPPTATITAISTNSTIGCGGSSSTVILSGTTTPTNSTFNWLPGNSSAVSLTVTTAGIYTLEAMDAVTGCSISTQFTVDGNTTPPQNVDAGSNTNIACGDATVALTGTTTSTNVSYSWTGPPTSTISGNTTPNPIVNEVGDYTLTVTDILTGCQSSATVNVIQAIATASIIATPTTGTSPLLVNFTGSGVGTPTYSWNFGDGSTSGVQNPANIFTTTGTYTVILTVSSGTCTATETVVIVVEDGFTLEIPNVFTPNNDGSNDVFTIKATGIKEISLQIFNRWGQKLYEFSGPKASWDGLVPNGSVAPEGTYFFFVKATGSDGKVIEKNGTMNLFR